MRLQNKQTLRHDVFWVRVEMVVLLFMVPRPRRSNDLLEASANNTVYIRPLPSGRTILDTFALNTTCISGKFTLLSRTLACTDGGQRLQNDSPIIGYEDSTAGPLFFLLQSRPHVCEYSAHV